MTWQERAACASPDVEPEIFFPRHRNDGAAEAKRVCAGCPVRFECGAYAHEAREEFGVWGGATEQQRVGAFPRNTYPPRKKPPTRTDICGSYAGSGGHRRRGESYCPECRAARNVYEAARKRQQRAALSEESA